MASKRFRFACALLATLLSSGAALAQSGTRAAPPTPAEQPKDTLGRDTPRGAVLGFMDAARKGKDDLTPLYLNTHLRDQAAVQLAHKLFVVLDSRLPARLNELSDRPEGSLANPLKPDQDLVGVINTANGPLDLIVERVSRGKLGSVWLFSRQTLDAVPEVFEEVDLVAVERYLPGFLTRTRIGGIRLFDWAALLLGVPFYYYLLGLLSRLLNPAVGVWRRRHGRTGRYIVQALPGFLRLLLVAVSIRLVLGSLDLPLIERQFWQATATLLSIGSFVWMFLLLNNVAETYLHQRARGSSYGEVAAILRLVRRVADGLVILAGVLVALRYFGVDPTAALAGLGIGGIAVALAAQKTLENVIGGLSLIFDKALRVGDFLKLGDTLGTVDDIGLRSTRIRTLDRTIVSVPNGQIASASIETLSVRDKFWFHHFVGLRYETTPAQLRLIVDRIRRRLAAHAAAQADSIRVRFFRLGAFSLDVEVFAYLFATDWERFLEMQEELLLDIMAIVEESGTTIAYPSQTLHIADGAAAGSTRLPAAARAPGLAASREAAGTT
jgi:MscS family membrane protein